MKLWLVLNAMILANSLWAQAIPRVSDFVSGLETPVSIVELAPDTFLIAQCSGKILRYSGRVMDSVVWFDLWPSEPGENIFRKLSNMIKLPSDDGELKVIVYSTVVDKENGQAFSHVSLIEERPGNETQPAFRELTQVLVNTIPGGTEDLGGAMTLGGDGIIFIGTGSVGRDELAQDDTSLAGKILRINLDGSTPSDNPSAGSPIWAKGFHSPAGMAYIAATQRLYVADKGPRPPLARNWDEVHFVIKNGNYGWPAAYGGRTGRGMVSPVIHSTGVKSWDPGGMVYISQGPWRNSLVWTGMNPRCLFRIVLDQGDPNKIMFFEELLKGQQGRLRAITVLNDGRILVGTDNQEGDAPSAEPEKIFIIQPR